MPKRPKDMTYDELENLPVKIREAGPTKGTITALERDDIALWTDRDGRTWRFDIDGNGNWQKERA